VFLFDTDDATASRLIDEFEADQFAQRLIRARFEVSRAITIAGAHGFCRPTTSPRTWPGTMRGVPHGPRIARAPHRDAHEGGERVVDLVTTRRPHQHARTPRIGNHGSQRRAPGAPPLSPSILFSARPVAKKNHSPRRARASHTRRVDASRRPGT
jgi:hypothetical protein